MENETPLQALRRVCSQGEPIKAVETAEEARAYFGEIIDRQAARIRELEGALRDLASYGERVKLDASTCDPAYWRQDIAHARRILEGGKP